MPRIHIHVGKLRVESDPEDQATARIIAEACGDALGVARERWGLEPPPECRLYVMSSWRGFIFDAAPWPWKVMLALNYPLWSGRARRTWPVSAGWTLRFGRRTAIGIKPPRLLDLSDKSVGMHMYVDERDATAKIRHLTCHELIHAASAHLRLPAWLNEGLAAVSVDRFMGKPTIREESLGLLERTRPKGSPPSYRALSRLAGETLAYHAVRGYWIVRFLEDVHPGFVRGLLSERRAAASIDRQLAERLGLQSGTLWNGMDDLVVRYFRRAGTAPT